MPQTDKMAYDEPVISTSIAKTVSCREKHKSTRVYCSLATLTTSAPCTQPYRVGQQTDTLSVFEFPPLLSGVLHFNWHYIDAGEKGVTFSPTQ